jgi:hypothetical protein
MSMNMTNVRMCMYIRNAWMCMGICLHEVHETCIDNTRCTEVHGKEMHKCIEILDAWSYEMIECILDAWSCDMREVA